MPKPIVDSVSFAGENAAGNLSITKTVDRSSAQPGEEVCYTLVIANTGKAAISSIQVQDKLPGQMLYVDKESTLGTTDDEAAGLWIISVLGAGAQARLALTGIVMSAEEDEDLVTTAEIISVDGFGPATHPTSFASVRLNAIRYGALTVAKAVQLSGASQEGFPFRAVFAAADGAAVHVAGAYEKDGQSQASDAAYPLEFELCPGETMHISVPGSLHLTVTEMDAKGYACVAPMGRASSRPVDSSRRPSSA